MLDLDDPRFIIGTPQYISPEEIQKTSMDGRADKYSLALTIFEALTRKQARNTPDVYQILREHCTERIRRASDIVPAISLDVSDVLIRAADPNPDNRYPNVRTFWNAFCAAVIDTCSVPSAKI